MGETSGWGRVVGEALYGWLLWLSCKESCSICEVPTSYDVEDFGGGNVSGSGSVATLFGAGLQLVAAFSSSFILSCVAFLLPVEGK